MSASQIALQANARDLADRAAPLPDGYTLRQLRLDDQGPLAALYVDSYGRDVVETAEDARQEMSETFASVYGPLELPWSPVIEWGGGLVACVMAVTSAPWPHAPEGPFIIEVIVDPSHRRRGLAACCLKACAEAVNASGGQTLSLFVMSDNDAALSLYRKLAFADAEGVGQAG